MQRGLNDLVFYAQLAGPRKAAEHFAMAEEDVRAQLEVFDYDKEKFYKQLRTLVCAQIRKDSSQPAFGLGHLLSSSLQRSEAEGQTRRLF
jgi:hypothetical protein